MKWTWKAYDHFILQHISYLLCDEFIDSELKNESLSIRLVYDDLKSVRKSFKLDSSLGGEKLK